MSETNGTRQAPQTQNEATESEKRQAYITEFFAGARIGRGLAGTGSSFIQLKRRLGPNRNGAVK